MLLLRRAVAALRRAHDRVVLIAPASSGAALVGTGPTEVDELLAWERPEVLALFAGGAATGPLRDRLRGTDLAVVYSRSAELAESLGRIVPRVVAHDPAPPGDVHASQWLAQALAVLGLDAPGELEPIRPRPADAIEARTLLAVLPDRFLAVHPGSGSPRKNWPPDRFAALVEARSPRRRWLLVEGPADAEAAAPLARRTGAVLARALHPRTLGSVLSGAGLFVGHDSGVTHLAAAWGAPTLALFGPTDPAVWAPVGRDVRVLRAPDGRMDLLSLEAVLGAVPVDS